jgi:hypothetical protein
MKHSKWCGWFGGLLVGSMLIAGCRHAEQDCGCGGTSPVATITVLPTYTPKPVTAAMPLALPESTPAKVAEVKEETAQPSQPIVQASLKEEPVKRRSFADITADPCFAHAADYSWVTGELQYMAEDHTWRVRYASVDEDDRYGGSLTLVDCGPMTNYLSGQKVRVEGHPNDADAKDASTTYKVSSISLLAIGH